jgi:hypothetical protein
MQLPGDWIWHISWLLLILAAMAVNRAIAQQRAERRVAVEAERLRAALAAELSVLDGLYRTNMQLLEKNANYVLSTRSPLLICRSTLGRLTLLFDVPVIEQLVALFARNEMLEAHIAAYARPKAGISYRLPPSPPQGKIERLSQMYAAAARDLEQTRAMLDRLEAPEPSPPWRLWPVPPWRKRKLGYLSRIPTNDGARAG